MSQYPAPERPLGYGKLISALYNSQRGKPVLVIGGGPSAPADLEKIPGWQDMFTISANGHAFKLPGCKPSLIMCKDHTRVLPMRLRRSTPVSYMEPEMRAFGVPIASRQYWADYRIAPWSLTGNSGMFAMALGVFLGGSPTIVVGIDCFQNGTYFHAPDEENVSNGLRPAHWQQRMRRFAHYFQGAPVRALSGVMAETFRRYDPAAVISDTWQTPIAMVAAARAQTQLIRIKRPLQDSFEKRATIPEGFVVPCLETEATRYVNLGVGERVDTDGRLVA